MSTNGKAGTDGIRMGDAFDEHRADDPVASVADSDPTPAVSTDRRGMRVLGLEECLTRLGDTALGRVGFFHDGEVTILPVNHVLDGVDVVFRTTWGSKLQVAMEEGPLAFEVDGHDPVTRTGWSVLVQGRAELVYDSDDAISLERRAGNTWLPRPEDLFWVRITAVSVTGREVIKA